MEATAATVEQIDLVENPYSCSSSSYRCPPYAGAQKSRNKAHAEVKPPSISWLKLLAESTKQSVQFGQASGKYINMHLLMLLR